MPDAVGVPLIVIVLDAKLALTPAGNPLAPDTPLFDIPVAPVVVCIMLGEMAVFIHRVVVVPAVAVLIVAGFHVPLIPLLEAAGSVGAVAPTQTGPIAVNTGVTCAAIVISIEAELAH